MPRGSVGLTGVELATLAVMPDRTRHDAPVAAQSTEPVVLQLEPCDETTNSVEAHGHDSALDFVASGLMPAALIPLAESSAGFEFDDNPTIAFARESLADK